MSCEEHPNAPHWRRGRGRCTECPPPGDPSLSTKTAVEDRTAPPAPPKGCATAADYEASLKSHGDYCSTQSRKIISEEKRKSNPSRAIAIKWAAEATKAWRWAAELAVLRERRGRRAWKEQLAADIRATRKRRSGGAN